MKEREYPRARVDCLTRKFGDEILVYDGKRNVGHCLNSTAAAAWKLCDGKNSVSDLAKILTRELSTPVNVPVVLLALEELSQARLLVEEERPVRRTSRRDAIRTIGIASAIALPIVTSLVAPTPARAASCLANGTRASAMRSAVQVNVVLGGIATAEFLGPRFPSSARFN